MAVGTLLQITLVDMATLVTNRIGNVESEIITAFLGSNLQQLEVLILREVLFLVHVQSRTTCKVLDVMCTM